MAFARFNGLAQDELGNALPNCLIEVRDENNGFLVPIYSDRDGNNQLTNPFTSADPNFFFHASGGDYRITATDDGGLVRTWNWVPLGTAQSADIEDLAISLQSGIIPVPTRADLNGFSPAPGGDQRPLGGVVWGDPNPSLNGYYTYNYTSSSWVKARPLPDTLAGLNVVSAVGNVVTVQASVGVDPGAVKAFYLDLEDWENTGPVTVRINGATAIPVHDVNGNEMAAGLATGRLFLSNEGTSLRMIVGGDYMAAVATALQYVLDAQAAAELAQDWAEGAEPGGPGTKSSKEWAGEAAAAVGDVADAIQEVALSAVPVGHIKMRFGPLTPGYFAMGEGGVFDRAANPDLAAWLDANGAALGLTAPQIAAGQLPDWRDYSPRTAGGTLGPAVGAKQQDAFQGHQHALRAGGTAIAGSGNGTPTMGATVFLANVSGVVLDPITDGTNGTPRTASETRVKSFGVRWEIKAFGAFVNQGTADLVAIATGYQTLLNGAVRFDVDQSSKTAAEKRRARLNVGSPFVDEYVSTEQVFVNGGLTTLTHGLGARPKNIALFYRCLITELGYVPGDEILILSQYDINQAGVVRGITLGSNTTNIFVKASSTGYPGLINVSTGLVTDITAANWRFIMRAWL